MCNFKSNFFSYLIILSLLIIVSACGTRGVTPGVYNPNDNSTLIQDNVVVANFDVSINGLTVATTNRSRVLDIGAAKFAWNFGDVDNPSKDKYDTISPKHTYQKSGQYQIILTVTSGEYTKTVAKVVDVIGNSDGGGGGGENDISANFTANISGRLVYFKNTTRIIDNASTTYSWYFGDSNTSTDINPVHKFSQPGDYQITLIAKDKNSSSVKQETLVIRVFVEPKIISYGDSNLVVDNKGRIYTWGANTDEFGKFRGTATSGSAGSGGATLGRGISPSNYESITNSPATPFPSLLYPIAPIFVNVFAGKNHVAAITDDDKLYLWGINDKGQLGLDNKVKQAFPFFYGEVNSNDETVVCGKYGIKDMVFTSKNGFALCNNGSVYATGLNDTAQLHDFVTANEQLKFIKINLSFEVDKLFASHETVYAVLADGKSVYAWGSNNKGVAGTNNSNYNPITVAEKIPFPEDAEVIKIVASDSYASIALTKDGRLFGWGFMQGNKNFIGIDGITLSSDAILSPLLLKNVSATGNVLVYRDVVLINRSVAAITQTGDLYTWGFYDNSSSLGLGIVAPLPEYIDTPTMVTLPQLIEFNSIRKSYYISGGVNHFTYLGKDGYVYGWGDNSRLQLGFKMEGAGALTPNLPIARKIPISPFIWRK